jgi:two-component system phosphate regulon sensor histidine kinase PhoR
MSRLIDDLLSLSRLETRTAIAPGDRADVVHIVEMVLESLSHQASEAGVKLERNLPAHPVEVNGDHDELFQVFENLVENAIKYGGSGGRIIVSVEPHMQPDGGVRVTVRDFGPGIESEHIPRVTERFYRVEVGTGRQPKGTGLGLSIVKHILTRHYARLAISSEPGQGATFTVTFPPL